MKIKIFWDVDEEELEKIVNLWIEERGYRGLQIRDMQFSTSGGIGKIIFSVLIRYDESK